MQKTDLKKTILDIQKRLKNHENLYQKNETAVRTQIVDPILFSLGWNTREPDQVRHEDNTDEGKADYCLIKNRKKVLFVEAKNLSKTVKSREHINQLAKYAFQEGVDYGVITNGREWLLLKSYEKNKRLEDREIWSVDLFDKFETVVNRLSCISMENISNIQSVIRRQKILLKNWRELMSHPEQLVKPISRIMTKHGSKVSDEETNAFVSMKLRELISESDDYEQIPKARIRAPRRPARSRRRNFDRAQDAKKTGMITIRGQSEPIRYSSEILFHTANYLFNHRLLNKSDLPIPVGKKRFLVNKEPKHPTGRMFFSGKKLDCGYYLETNYNKEGCIEKARLLLKMAGLSERDLKIK